MSNSKLFFFIIFGIYHLAVFLLAYYVDVHQEDIVVQLGQDNNLLGLLRQITFAGLFLLLANVGWSWYSDMLSCKKEKALRAEIDQTKAKMYDMQAKQEPSNAEVSDEPEEPTQS